MGYLSTPNPHMISGAIAALSLLIHNDSGICISVPNLIPAVLALLQSKSVEVIKVCLNALCLIFFFFWSKYFIQAENAFHFIFTY
jgi:hypothetical protein